MPHSLNISLSKKNAMQRRVFLGALPVFFLVSACARAAKKIDGKWGDFGENRNTIDHSAWDEILAAYLAPSKDGINLVNYAALKANAAVKLKAYLAALQAIPITDYVRDEQFAYWVNLYNAATVQKIIENYPLKSIRDIGLLGQGPWKDKFLKVAGKMISLDDIEHGILRPIWKDVRIHYAVNCASIGCPNLALKAYRADTLEVMLEEAASAFINHPRGFAVKDEELIASNIFEWYQIDWVSEEDVIAHARKYAQGKTAQFLKEVTVIDSYDYNWTLNEAK